MSDTKTVSGNIVHIQDKGAPTALSVIVDINPKQSGSGTPSPDNVRQISGWTEVVTHVSPTTSAEDGETYTTDLGRTVYGATLDVVSGVLTVDRAMVDLGSLDWQYRSEVKAGLFSNVALSDYKHSTDLRCICENYDYEGTVESVSGAALKQNGQLCFYVNSLYPNNSGLYIIDNRFTSKDDFKTAVTGVKLVYELAIPQTYTLTGQNVTLLKDCYAWADSGDISITYETYLINGLFHKILINGVKMFAPNDFTLERSDVYAGEITTCTGKTIADRIGWKYADMSLNWDYLPQEYLETILNLSGVFTITFENEEGVQFTEQCIRKGSTMTGTRFTDNGGNMMWKGVQFDISFINVHN